MQTKLSKMLKISCRINKLSIVCLKLFNYRFSFLCVYRSMQLFVALSYRLGGLNHLNIDYNYQLLKPCLVCKMNNYLMVCIMLIQKYNCFIKIVNLNLRTRGHVEGRVSVCIIIYFIQPGATCTHSFTNITFLLLLF